jgi:predicted anti-sigma-YlaC factor YlaD
MGPIDFLFHLLSFLAPAVGVALGVGFAARLLWPGRAAGRWWRAFAANAAVGTGVLGAGLWFFGQDGKMATYAALVLAIATMQWLMSRGWRG